MLPLDLSSTPSESSGGELEQGNRDRKASSGRGAVPRHVLILAVAALGVVGALGLGGATGGVAAVIACLVVPGYALSPNFDFAGAADGWVVRIVFSTALVALSAALSVTLLPVNSSAVLFVLLILSAGLIVVRRPEARRRLEQWAWSQDEDWPETQLPNLASSQGTAMTQYRAPIGWVLVLDEGRRVPVRGRVLLGRQSSDQARQHSLGDEVTEQTFLRIEDETGTVSRGHVLMDFTADPPLLTDQGSSNGTWITGSEGTSRRAQPGVPVSMHPGDVVSLGRRWLTLRTAE